MPKFLIASLALCLVPAFAEAQNRNCGPRDNVISTLAEKYKETRRSIGLATKGRVMEVYASEESGSWTIVVTMPNGITCVHIDPESGLRARIDDVDAPLECFRRGSEPRTFAPIWRYDPALGTETLVTDETVDPHRVTTTPPETRGTQPLFQ